MKVGFFLTGIAGRLDLAEMARWGAEHGYQAMDVPSDRDDARAICDRQSFQFNCTSSRLGDVLTTDDNEREAQIDLLKRAIVSVAAQGIPCLSCAHHRDPSVNAEENIRLFQLGFKPLAAYAVQEGVRLVFEGFPNRGRDLMITPERWDRAFNAVPSDALGLNFDPSHLVWQGIDYLRAARDLGSRIYHAHAKNTELLPDGQYRYGIYGPPTDAPRDSAGWWRYRLPGFGVIDWPKYVDTLYLVGFDGVLSVEHEDHLWGFTTDVERWQRGLVLTRQILAPLLV